MADTKLIGILNVTPDSFSDGGKFMDKDAAIAAIRRMAADGASVIDIGAESTRPGALSVSPDEEWRRLEPVLQALPAVRGSGVKISIDTRHVATARKALEFGADWINDVTGFSSPMMVEAVKETLCTLVVMHSLGIPANKSITLPQGIDVAKTLIEWGHERINQLTAQGIDKSRIVFDPGIGFGKTQAQSLEILRNIETFSALGVRLLVGHSRKSFLAGMGDRDDATLAASLYLAERGVDYLRVHDVVRHTHMLGVWNSIVDDDQPAITRRSA